MPSVEHGNPSYLDGNSHKSKDALLHEERKKAEPVVQSVAVKRRKPLSKRVSATEPDEIRQRVIFDVLIPTAKEMVWKGFSTALSLALYGDVRDTRTSAANRERVPYNSMYDQRRRQQVRSPLYDFDDVLFDGSGDMLKAESDARAVLDELRLYLDEYGFVSVAEFYEFSGYQTQHTDNRWGWTDLSGARIIRVRDGYVVDLPKPRPLEDYR